MTTLFTLPGAPTNTRPPLQANPAVAVNNPYGQPSGSTPTGALGNPGAPTTNPALNSGAAGSMTPINTIGWDPNYGQLPDSGGVNPATTSGAPPAPPTPTEDRRNQPNGGMVPTYTPSVGAPELVQNAQLPTPPMAMQAPPPTPSTFSLDPISSQRELTPTTAGNIPTPTPTTTGNIPAPVAPDVPNAPRPFNSQANPVQGRTVAPTSPVELAEAMAYNPRGVGVGKGNRVDVGTDEKYAREALANALSDLNPVFEERQAALQQNLVNRGLAPGSDAYNKAMESYSRQHADAYSQAAFDAQRYGLQAQNQFFNQGVANEQLGYQDRALGLQANLANERNRLMAAQMAESQRQFDAGFGLQQNNQQFGQNFANAQMANAMDQFNAQQGLAVDNANFGRDLASANFGLNAANSNFANQLASGQFDLAQQGQAFGQNLAAGQFDLAQQGQAFGQNLAANQFGLAQDAQNFGQNLASGQFGLAQDAQNWGQTMDSANFGLAAQNSDFANQMQSAGLQNAMDQFASQFGLQSAQFQEGQNQFAQQQAMQEYLARMQRDAAYANSRPSMAELNQNQYNIDRQFDLSERGLMADILGMMMGGFQNYQSSLFGP